MIWDHSSSKVPAGQMREEWEVQTESTEVADGQREGKRMREASVEDRKI